MKNPTLEALLRGISSTESGNNYNAIGPRTKSGHRAYGFSQVLDTNIAPWTKQFYGQELTPEQYLNTPVAQDKVTQGKLGELLQKHGTPQDAASVWFSGRPLDRSVNASDGFLKTPEYIQRVMQAGGMPGSFNDARSFQATGTDEMANAANQPPGAQSISLGDQENSQPFNNIGSTLANMGASIASLDNRGTGIASLNASRVAQNLTAQENARQRDDTPQLVGFNADKTMMMMRKGNQIYSVATPQGFGGEEKTTLEKNLDLAEGDSPRAGLARQALGIVDTPALDTADFNRILDKEVAGGKIGPNEFGTGKQSNANRIAYQKFKTENLKPFGISENDLVQAASNTQFRTRMARDLGGTEGRFTLAYNNFMGGAGVLEKYSQAFPREWPQIVEAARQGSIKQLNVPGIGAGELGALETAFDTTAVEYAKAKNPGNTQLSITEQNDAKTKFRATMSHEELMGRIGAMKGELNANRERMLRLHQNIIGDKIQSPLESAIDDAPQQQTQMQPQQSTTTNTDKALPMPSNIKSPDEFMAYARANKIPVGTPFKMGDKTIYVQSY
jgi:hypothetical protein